MTRASRALIASALIGLATTGGEALGADFARGVQRGKVAWSGAAHHGRRAVNDRGPFAGGRVIDISQSAALVIGLAGGRQGGADAAMT